MQAGVKVVVQLGQLLEGWGSEKFSMGCERQEKVLLSGQGERVASPWVKEEEGGRDDRLVTIIVGELGSEAQGLRKRKEAKETACFKGRR